jgi:Zn-dependent metalloprotease
MIEQNKCKCTVIPPHVEEQIKKRAPQHWKEEDSKLTQELKEKRKKKSDDIAGARGGGKGKPSNGGGGDTTPSNNADRKVYDCNNRTRLRKGLALSEGGSYTSDDVINTVYDNAGFIRSFFKTYMDWLGYDDQGSDLHLNVHYSRSYNNAFWDGDDMVFGDGDGVIFTNFGNSLDVTAHELTHGVVQFTANLIYNGQPGALNEHMADVFGVAIRQHTEGQTSDPANANWLIGDTIMGPTLQGQAIRNMKNPGTAYDNEYMGKDPQPDHMDGYYYGSSDNYGVHINSGIPNKVFYLASVAFGDTMKSALLWFETLKTMGANDNFDTFKIKLLNKTQQLEGEGKVPTGAVSMIETAFSQVGL